MSSRRKAAKKPLFLKKGLTVKFTMGQREMMS